MSAIDSGPAFTPHLNGNGPAPEPPAPPPLLALCDLTDGAEAECFALLARRERGVTKKGERFYKCYFRDKKAVLEAPIWANSPFIGQVEGWVESNAYRLLVRAENKPRYGMQIELLAIRPATPALDEADGYSFFDLVESSKYGYGVCLGKIRKLAETSIDDPALLRLVLTILERNEEAFQKMPAAQNLHHGFTGGLAEHIWSVTRVACTLAKHYEAYYDDLDPPLDRGLIVAAAILHDIGKLQELQYSPAEASYTTVGQLVGHVLIGRDMVRETAKELGGVSAETLMLLEHAILAHHGRGEYGAPKEPRTLEALIVHYADELDAKLNAVYRERQKATGDGLFTDKIYAVENRRFYRGIRRQGAATPPDDDPAPPL
jgi:3'-5' exoribonuclease